MTDTPTPPPQATQRKSRILAALDNPAFFSSTSTPTPPPPSQPPASLGLGLPPPYQVPMKMRQQTPSIDESMLLNAAQLLTKRKYSGPENEFDDPLAPGGSSPMHTTIRQGGTFRLNYDQESAVRSIDRGGPDQEQRCAESPL